MRGDQSARQCWVIGAIEASPNGLTMAEIPACDGHVAPVAERLFKKPIPITGMGFFVIRNRSRRFLDGQAGWRGE